MLNEAYLKLLFRSHPSPFAEGWSDGWGRESNECFFGESLNSPEKY